MSIISSQEIRRRIFDEDDEDKVLVVTPLLDPAGQIQTGSSSIDVRLGTHFLVQRRTNVTSIEPGRRTGLLPSVSRVDIPFGREFVLHPNQFVLGCTLEFIRMPLDLSAYLVSRSSWGRLGLIVATAIGIHPGFRGIITLELRNLGEVPFIIKPGRSIAQVFFHTVQGPVAAEGVKSYSIGDSIPQAIYDFHDSELPIIDDM